MKNIFLVFILLVGKTIYSQNFTAGLEKNSYAPLYGNILSDNMSMFMTYTVKISHSTSATIWQNVDLADKTSKANFLGIIQSTNFIDTLGWKINWSNFLFFPEEDYIPVFGNSSVISYVTASKKWAIGTTTFSCINNFPFYPNKETEIFDPVFKFSHSVSLFKAVNITGIYWLNKDWQKYGIQIESAPYLIGNSAKAYLRYVHNFGLYDERITGIQNIQLKIVF